MMLYYASKILSKILSKETEIHLRHFTASTLDVHKDHYHYTKKINKLYIYIKNRFLLFYIKYYIIFQFSINFCLILLCNYILSKNIIYTTIDNFAFESDLPRATPPNPLGFVFTMPKPPIESGLIIGAQVGLDAATIYYPPPDIDPDPNLLPSTAPSRPVMLDPLPRPATSSPSVKPYVPTTASSSTLNLTPEAMPIPAVSSPCVKPYVPATAAASTPNLMCDSIQSTPATSSPALSPCNKTPVTVPTVEPDSSSSENSHSDSSSNSLVNPFDKYSPQTIFNAYKTFLQNIGEKKIHARSLLFMRTQFPEALVAKNEIGFDDHLSLIKDFLEKGPIHFKNEKEKALYLVFKASVQAYQVITVAKCPQNLEIFKDYVLTFLEDQDDQ